MATALEWVLTTILDELDAILDEKDRDRGIVRTQAVRMAGRKAMEPMVRAMLRSEEAAAELRSAGAANVRTAVRRMYELKLLN